MDIKQDPNAIPNFNADGRLGEAQPQEPEQAQSSVQLDRSADGDGAAAEDGSGLAARPGQVNAAGAGPTARGNGPAAPQQDASKTGAGAVDGLVGAP